MKVSSTSAPIEFWGDGVDADDVWFRSHESVIHAPRAPVDIMKEWFQPS